MQKKTAALAQSPLFRNGNENLPFRECIRLSYSRAKAITEIYELTASDILYLSPRYWEFHTDPILVMDGSVGTLLTIQYNLCIGTLASFTKGRPDIEKIISEALDYRISGQFCLTEVDHGLNALNIETSATLQSNGDFILHTPHLGAAKYMPPTCPFGIPCVAVVFARLIVEGEDYGIRGFLIKLHDGYEMTPGVICRLLPPRGGARPVGHSLTSFDQVHLPSNALLGSLKKPRDIRESFFQSIQRVITGTLSMGAFALSTLRVGSYIGTAYSLRREVIEGSTRITRPVSSFSTQYIPLLSSIAQTFVFRAFGQEMYEHFVDPGASITQKHFVASVFKTTVYRHAIDGLLQIGDRCGAQGLFEVNQLSATHADLRGAAIAEGDILGISIRFAIDILRGKVKVPKPKFPDHLLAKHERSIINELRVFLTQTVDHRSLKVERMLLPHCRGVLEAIGHRCASEAALARGVSQPIIDLYVASLFDLDAAWYSENVGISRWKQKSLLLERATALYGDLPRFLELLEVKSYVTAPIVSKERWEKYTLGLPCYMTEPAKL